MLLNEMTGKEIFDMIRKMKPSDLPRFYRPSTYAAPFRVLARVYNRFFRKPGPVAKPVIRSTDTEVQERFIHDLCSSIRDVRELKERGFLVDDVEASLCEVLSLVKSRQFQKREDRRRDDRRSGERRSIALSR